MNIIEAIMNWKTLTGLGIVGTIIFVILIFHYGGEEAVNLPNTVEEIKENATEMAEDALIEATEESSKTIFSETKKIGDDLADSVDDPRAKSGIRSSMALFGFGLFLLIVLVILSPFLKK